ncbi:DUF4258 domain-containing protein [Amorphus coralli]|uniref:DUF4258 domain-containing protein n=1 Tax=Amorphus coralli TaxID=340680 RepID=UPI000361122D|nr:DUF4258 domain-containing protein [Amorphus coralli]
MEGLFVSAHANARMNQRGIRGEVVEVLFAYGRRERSSGADVYFMDRAARQRVRGAIGAKAYARLEKGLDAYLVVSNDGTLITTAKRLRRFRR